MNSPSYNSTFGTASKVVSDSAEVTLRLIARLPAPKGIEDRVNSSLKNAPRGGRVLHWPAMMPPTGGWMRGAAAAAIVFVVTGGGWGVYTHVQPTQSARVIAMPRAGVGGGFSSAGAMRTPQTLNGTVVTNPVAVQPEKDHPGIAQPAQVKPVQVKRVQAKRVHFKPLKKVHSRNVRARHGRAHAVAGNKASAQPAVSVAK